MAHGRGWPNRLVRTLRFLLLFKCVGRFGQIILPIFFADIFADFCDRLGRNPRGVGAHVGDETNGAFFAKFHAFGETLRNHHGALDAEAQLARGVLLQLAGREGRRGVAPAFFLVDRTNNPLGLFERDADLFSFFAVIDLDLLLALAQETRVKGRRLVGGKVGVDRPVLFFLERLDFAFAFDDQAKSKGLHPSGGKTSADLVPKQRGDLISHEAIENAAGLLRINEVLIDRARMFECCLYRAFGNFVEGHTLYAWRSLGLSLFRFFRFLLFRAVFSEFIRQVRRDGFAFTVRVRREIDGIGGGSKLFQLGDNFFFAGNDNVVGRKIVVDIHTQSALGQILDMPERSFHREALTQIFLDGLRLGRRFDND